MHTSALALIPLLLLASSQFAPAGIVTRRWGTPPRARAAPAAPKAPDRPTAYAPVSSEAPKVDGRLDDAAWRTAPVLRLARTLDGAGPAAQPTEVRLLRYAGTITIAIRCIEPTPARIKATRRPRDGSIWHDDAVEIFLGARGTYYHIGINAVGSIYDAKVKDASWDSGAQVAVARGKAEWSVELTVPLDRIIGKGIRPPALTANFTRSRYASGAVEESAWSPTFSSDSHVPARFGMLLMRQPPAPKPRQPERPPAVQAGTVSITPCPGGEGIARFDLSDLPKGARIYRADLRVYRTSPIDGADDDALIDIAIFPLFAPVAEGARPEPAAKPLPLRPPWHDRLDATEAVQRWANGETNGGFFVKTCPRWNAQATTLDVAYEGAAENVPTQVGALRVLHRKGHTFIVFGETDERSAEASLPWSELRDRLAKMDADREVRYRVYRHTERITSANLHQAAWLGDVKPMSAYNTRGRSVDQLIAVHRRRAIDDLEFARQLARSHYFSRYNPDMPEIGDVPVARLAIEDGKPLPPKTGLYVHQPTKPGRAFYAVVSVVDGVANTRDVSPANSLPKPVDQVVGTGEPVFQGDADVTVFFDYPGRRSHYVQWAAPPLANLPNQYYNWGVFVPAGFRGAAVRRLSVFFHDSQQRYLKPPWPHRQDTALLSPHDAPYRSFGYGYHEALGTLRSFRQGRVHPYFARRVDAMVDWAVTKLGADPGRLSCGGRGYWGGTAALQYGLRRPGRMAYVMAEASPDANPRETPLVYSHYGRGDRRKTRRPDMDAVWGRPEWQVPTETGKSVWDEMDLPAYVRTTGTTHTLPFLSLGAGSMHLTWKQESDLMKAYLGTHNAFMAEFFWGSSAHKPLPVGLEQEEHPFEPRADGPILACNPKNPSPNAEFFPKQFDTGKRGYGGGSRLNTRPRWHPDDIVDQPDRLEITIYAGRRVVYGGNVACDTWIRNMRKFHPRPGQALTWVATDVQTKKPRQEGQTTVDEHGFIPIPALEFARPARLLIRRADAEGGAL